MGKGNYTLIILQLVNGVGKRAFDNMNKECIFVVHKHKGKVLHYDFRLEIGACLKSWAIPKGPSLNPKNKRLAIITTDHHIDYANFEGYIEEGYYGAGPVIVWDIGTVIYENDPIKSFNRKKIGFELKGKKLKGVFTIFELKNSPGNWLLIKKNDQSADVSGKEIVDTKPKSAISGLSLEQIEKLYKEGKIKPYRCQ